MLSVEHVHAWAHAHFQLSMCTCTLPVEQVHTFSWQFNFILFTVSSLACARFSWLSLLNFYSFHCTCYCHMLAHWILCLCKCYCHVLAHWTLILCRFEFVTRLLSSWAWAHFQLTIQFSFTVSIWVSARFELTIAIVFEHVHLSRKFRIWNIQFLF